MKRMQLLINKTRPGIVSAVSLILLSFTCLAQGKTAQESKAPVKQDKSLFTDSVTDREYKQAVWLTKNKLHNEAKKILLHQNPRPLPSEILLGRLYAWDKQFDSARIFLQKALYRQPGNEEAMLAMSHVELWSGHPDKALQVCNDALLLHPHSEKLLVLKAKAYARLSKYPEAQQVNQQVLQMNPANKDALELEKYLKRKTGGEPAKTGIGISYQHDQFNSFYAPWNSGSLYLFHKGKAGAVSGGVNYMNRFQSTGMQYELNLYPRLSRTMKAYLGAAYSKDSILPGLNLDAGLNHTLFRKTELELGVRYLKFYNLVDPLWIYTGAFNISVQHFWFSARAYIRAQPAGQNQSYYLTSRYYINDKGNYITLILGTGTFPHDYFDPVTGKTFNYSTHSERIRLEYRAHLLSAKNIVKLAAGYEKREYSYGFTLGRTTAGIGFERLF